MRTLCITLRYDGAAYHGWQVQKNGVTVQEKLQNAIEAVCGRREDVKGCSRTDAGVHAEMFCCSFVTEAALSCETWIRALNAHLPADIAVYACREVPADFHARYSCTGKKYIYKIWNAPYRNPFCRDRFLHYPYALDADFLHKEAQALLGRHDFAAFCASGSSVEDTVREIRKIGVERHGEEVWIYVEADGFLYNMVRIIVGSLLGIAQGKLTPGSLPEILASLDRARAGATAPACGLYLTNVYYGA